MYIFDMVLLSNELLLTYMIYRWLCSGMVGAQGI